MSGNQPERKLVKGMRGRAAASAAAHLLCCQLALVKIERPLALLTVAAGEISPYSPGAVQEKKDVAVPRTGTTRNGV